MNDFTLYHMVLWQNDTNTYAKNDAEGSKWINALLITTSTDELNIWVNGNFDLLKIIEQGGIVHLKLMLDKRFFMYEAFFQALHTRLKQLSQ